ncbi:MAG TPA: flavodoxin domain-containing protein [Anaerolineales bacterium]|nr:flavodoxin domain-containing protein [Anaerolineales bacterium]
MTSKKPIGRREFIIGASVLAAGGLAALAVQQPAIAFPTETCGVGGSGRRKILVAYGSQYGTTGDVADAIGRVFCGAGHRVDVAQVKADPDPAGYDAVVIGAPVHADAWLSEATTYVGDHHAALSRVPVAYFLTCMTLGLTQQPEDRARIAEVFTAVHAQVPDVQPVDAGLFAGALDFGRMSLANQLMYRAFAEDSTEGDHRDWSAIRSWAAALQPRLTSAGGETRTRS